MDSHTLEVLIVAAILVAAFGREFGTDNRMSPKNPPQKQLPKNPAEASPPGPQPEDFGLTAQEEDSIELFTRCDYVSENIVFGLLAVGVVSSTAFLFYIWGWEHWGVILLVGFFAGCLLIGGPLVIGAGKIRNWTHARATRRLPKYPDYVRYEEACRNHSAYVQALVDARREAETQRQNAEKL